MKFLKGKPKAEIGQLTIDPKLNDVLKKRKPSPKLEEANIVIERLLNKKEYADFFSTTKK